MTTELHLPDIDPFVIANSTLYPLKGVWCPGTCGGDVLIYVAPSYGSSSDYLVFCLHCDWRSA